MRFAYIDSNGNEVPIPSVDALALRIELGAITDDTQLYDAQADQWGPAHTHEIYHTLSRSSGDDGFIAPPPVAPPPTPTGPPTPPESSEPEEAESMDALAPEPEATPEEVELDVEVVEEVDEVDVVAEDASDLGLTLAEPSPSPGEEGSEPDDGLGLTLAEPPAEMLEESGDAALDFGGLEFGSEEDSDSATSDDAQADEGGDDALTPSFDFGGMEGSLELEETFEAPEEPVMDFGPPETTEGGAAPGGGLAGGDDLGLEAAMTFDPGSFEMDSGDALDLEKPMSEFSPEEPPAWMESDGAPSGEGEVLDFSAASGDEEAAEVPLRERRTPKNKPSPPKLRRRRNYAGPLVGVVILVALGVGGYTAWPVLSERLSSSGEDEEPAVFIPTISAELMPQMRSTAEAALAVSFDDVHQEWVATSTVQAPPTEWLAGIYLANASDYVEAAEFWEGIADLLDGVRGIDLSTFDAAVQAQAAAAGLSEADAEAIRERADSGFVAGAPEREAAYDRVQAVVDAALQLHRFLEANEANIDYVPATAMTTDPVLEVDPATEEIRVALGDMIGQVTQALTALGYRDQVSVEGLRTRLLEQVQENGIR